MTQKDKELLLKDLCARLPYGVKVKILDKDVLLYESSDVGTIVGKENVDDDIYHIKCGWGGWCLTVYEHFIPYLRPMSSMTDDEKKSYHIIKDRLCEVCIHGSIKDIAYWTNALDLWFYKYHFDNSNLIEKGLALEAPEGMYKED